MRLSRAPDLGAPRLMLAATLLVVIVTAAVLWNRDAAGLAYGLGDTDDATRMVLVRDLLAGRGWYDQLVERLQPPMGLQMHWSRLIDGGIATLISLFRLVLAPGQAEYAARIVWPMLWIAPAVWGGLAAARRLAGGAAVFAGSILMVTELTLYIQFRPGRIDHHGPQIALFMLALGGAAAETVAGAAIAGVATGLGLAVGLESMIFAVAVGAFFPLVYLFARDPGGRRMLAYAVGLALTTAAAFLIQTPPWRWGVVACDAIAANLVAAVVVAGVGLAVTAKAVGDRDWRWRLGALVAAGAAAAAVYIALDPSCLAGPFADVDPRLKTFWLQYVQEIRPITKFWPRARNTVYDLMAPGLFGAVAWLWLGADRRRRTQPFWILSGVCLLLAIVAGASAIRMATYANWIAIALVAAAVTDAVDRYAKGLLLALAIAAVAATPIYAASIVTEVDEAIVAAGKPKAKAAPKPVPKRAAAKGRAAGVRGDRCFHEASYAALAAQPPGLVLSAIDLGPFILAYTKSSAMAAPYHRMNWGLVTARGVMSAEAEAAQAQARRLGFRYVLDCPAHARNGDRVGMTAGSLQKRLDADKAPSWLERVDDGKGPLRVYRVRPPADLRASPPQPKQGRNH
jgi:hypothetical protein